MVAHIRQRVLGQVYERLAGLLDLETTEARCTGRNADRELEAHPGLPQLGVSRDQPDGGATPERTDHPGLLGRCLLELGRAHDRERLTVTCCAAHGHTFCLALATWSAPTTGQPSAAAASRLFRARR